jgi:hypothetical protein
MFGKLCCQRLTPAGHLGIRPAEHTEPVEAGGNQGMSDKTEFFARSLRSSVATPGQVTVRLIMIRT